MEKAVPKIQVDAVLEPIPEKGDQMKCDNWPGISLQDVLRKVLARLIML